MLELDWAEQQVSQFLSTSTLTGTSPSTPITRGTHCHANSRPLPWSFCQRFLSSVSDHDTAEKSTTNHPESATNATGQTVAVQCKLLRPPTAFQSIAPFTVQLPITINNSPLLVRHLVQAIRNTLNATLGKDGNNTNTTMDAWDVKVVYKGKVLSNQLDSYLSSCGVVSADSTAAAATTVHVMLSEGSTNVNVVSADAKGDKQNTATNDSSNSKTHDAFLAALNQFLVEYQQRTQAPNWDPKRVYSCLSKAYQHEFQSNT